MFDVLLQFLILLMPLILPLLLYAEGKNSEVQKFSSYSQFYLISHLRKHFPAN